MTIELHHFFILTDPGALSADHLSCIGLIEGASNDHPGQGTANRRFFFSNSALELLYVSDASEAKTGPGRRLRFAERAIDPKASPFGLVVSELSEATKPPFPSWPYCPQYFQDHQCFHVGENSDLFNEPLCICMPSNLPPPQKQPRLANSHMTVTEVQIGVPVARPSATLEAIAKCSGISLRLNESHRMLLTLNEGKDGQRHDLTPDLPLIVRW
ncbi:MAG: hypothetical protein AAF329_04285 [Cyanobacteria bacterium P01_A01_bin.17]